MKANPQTDGASPFLNTRDAAIYLGMHLRSLENMRWRGEGPRYRKHGGLVRYHVGDLESWSDSRGNGAT